MYLVPDRKLLFFPIPASGSNYNPPEADIKPDEENKTLTVSLHNLKTPVSDRIVCNLCQEINATKTISPGSSLRLVYKLVSDQICPNQVI